METWEAWLSWLGNADPDTLGIATHIVEKLSVKMVSDDLATVTLIGHTDGKRVDFRAVVVLTHKQGGKWLIVSWTQENTVPAAKPEEK